MKSLSGDAFKELTLAIANMWLVMHLIGSLFKILYELPL